MARPRMAIMSAGAFTIFVACSEFPTTTGSIGVPRFGKGAGPAPDIPVSSELRNAGLNIQSDGAAYLNGVNGVTSVLQGYTADWELDLTGRSSTRKVAVDLTDPLPDNPLASPFSVALVPGRFIARATQTTPGSFGAMAGLNSTIQSPLSLSFAYGGKQYGLRLNPANHPTTEWALVACTGVDAQNACNAWRVTPNGSHGGVSKSIARLEQVNTKGTTLVGYYYLSFDIVIAK